MPDRSRSQVQLRDFNVAPSYRTMALDTISVRDDHRVKPRVFVPRADDDPWYYPSTSVLGIHGAITKTLRAEPVLKKQTSLAKDFGDVPGMAPTQLHRATPKNVPDTNLRTDDIPGTKPNPKDVIKKPRGTDPPAPQYAVPKYDAPAPEVGAKRRGTRDGLRVDDIEGTRSRRLVPEKPMRGAREDRLDAKDIAGTTVGWKPPYRAHFGKDGHERSAHSTLTSADIDGGTTTYPYKLKQREHKRDSEVRAIIGCGPRPLGHVVTKSTEAAFAGRTRSEAERDNSLRKWDVDGSRPTLPEEIPFRHMPPRLEGKVTHGGPKALTRTETARAQKLEVAAATAHRAATKSAIEEYVAATTAPVDPSALVTALKRKDTTGSGRIARADVEAALGTVGCDPAAFEPVHKLMADDQGNIQYRDLARFAVPALTKKHAEARQGEKESRSQEQAPPPAPYAEPTKADAAPPPQEKLAPSSGTAVTKFNAQRYSVERPKVRRPKSHIADAAMTEVGSTDVGRDKKWRAKDDAARRGKMMACGLFEFENWSTQQLLAQTMNRATASRVAEARNATNELNAATRRIRLRSAPMPARRVGLSEVEARQAHTELNRDMETIRGLA